MLEEQLDLTGLVGDERSEQRPSLRLLNTETGELVQDDRDFIISELTNKYHGVLAENGKLKKEIRDLRLVEPEAQQILDVLEYCRDRINKPGQKIIPEGKRWKNVRARFMDKPTDRPPFTTEDLKLAVDGALLDPWYNGTAPGAPKDGRYLDAKSIFATSERVEAFVNSAKGFNAAAGVDLRDLLDVMSDLQFVDWKFMLRTCFCGHRRFEHGKADPNREGREVCLTCSCEDFDLDPLDAFNQKVDPHLREHYGRWSA